VKAPVTYVEDFLAPEMATAAYAALWPTGIAWERRANAPRDEYWTNSLDRAYTYGRREGERTYHPGPSHALIDDLNMAMVAAGYVDRPYEGCFLNHYRDGTDALGWHADDYTGDGKDDKGIDQSRPIAVITLYSAAPKPDRLRMIQFRAQAGGEIESLPLAHGSLALMGPGMQNTHFHKIPKAGYEVLPRISLTYRGLC
jgi:alkylated DNA repair dioxygenase AlkB